MNCYLAHLQIHAYLDGELAPGDALSFEAHLMDCAECRKEFEALLATVETVRGAQGVYEATERSRQRAAQLIATSRRGNWRVGAIAAALAIGAFLTWFVHARPDRPDLLTEFAAESHLHYANGRLPLDIRSEEPKAVAAWLSARLPFRLNLPNYPEPPGSTKKYVLEGARLLQSGSDDVAYLAYRMDRRPISLLMTTSARIVPRGGEIYYSGGLAFHSKLYKGLRVITWSDKGLHYALVSELATGGAQSCMVCHGSEEEHQKFAPLRRGL
ncbi:MAG TPA: zf-HC2 domain-containing protein [Bryobacteraceae bacterium]